MFRRKASAGETQPTPADAGINEFVHMSFGSKENDLKENDEEVIKMPTRNNTFEMDSAKGRRGPPTDGNNQMNTNHSAVATKARGREMKKDNPEAESLPKKKRSKSKKKKKTKKKKTSTPSKSNDHNGKTPEASSKEVAESDWETDGEGAGDVTDVEAEYFAPKDEDIVPVAFAPKKEESMPNVVAAADYMSDDSLELMVEERSRYSRYTTVDDDDFDNIPGDDRYAAGASQNPWEEQSLDDSAPARWRSFDEAEQVNKPVVSPKDLVHVNVPKKLDVLKDLEKSEQKPIISTISPRVDALLNEEEYDIEKNDKKAEKKRHSKNKRIAEIVEKTQKDAIEKVPAERQDQDIRKIPSDTSSLTDPLVMKKPSMPRLHRAKPEDFQGGRNNMVEVRPPHVVQTGPSGSFGTAPSNSLDEGKGSYSSGSKSRASSRQRRSAYMSTLSPVVIGASFDEEAKKKKESKRRFVFGTGSKSKGAAASTTTKNQVDNNTLVPASNVVADVSLSQKKVAQKSMPSQSAPSKATGTQTRASNGPKKTGMTQSKNQKSVSSGNAHSAKKPVSKLRKGLGIVKGLQVLSPVRKRENEETSKEKTPDNSSPERVCLEENKDTTAGVDNEPVAVQLSSKKEGAELVIESREEDERVPEMEAEINHHHSPAEEAIPTQPNAMHTKSLVDSSTLSSIPSEPTAREGPPSLNYSPKRGRSPRAPTSPRTRAERSLSPRQSQQPAELDEYAIPTQVQEESALVQCLNFYNFSSAAKVAGVLISATDCRSGLPTYESFEVQMLGAEKSKSDKKESTQSEVGLVKDPAIVSPKVEMVLELDQQSVQKEENHSPPGVNVVPLGSEALAETVAPENLETVPVVSEDHSDSTQSAPELGRTRSHVREVSGMRLHLDGESDGNDHKTTQSRQRPKVSSDVSVTSIQFKAKQQAVLLDDDSDGSSTDIGIATPAANFEGPCEGPEEVVVEAPKIDRGGFLKMFKRKPKKPEEKKTKPKTSLSSKELKKSKSVASNERKVSSIPAAE